jgi:hypothetical protein
VPSSELRTDLRHPGDLDEADALVKTDGGLVLPGDGSHHDVLAEHRGGLTEAVHQGPPYPVAPTVLADMDRVLDGEPVAGPLRGVPKITEGAPADELAGNGRHQHGVAQRALAIEPVRPFGNRVGYVGPLNGRGREQGVLEVDDGRDVGVDSLSDDDVDHRETLRAPW